MLEKNQDLTFFQKHPKFFAYNSSTKHRSEAVLNSNRMAEYPLLPHIKTIAVAFLQAAIYRQQGCFILENRKKHPILTNTIDKVFRVNDRLA